MAGKAENIDYLALYSVRWPTIAHNSLADAVIQAPAYRDGLVECVATLRGTGPQMIIKQLQHRTHQAD